MSVRLLVALRSNEKIIIDSQLPIGIDELESESTRL